MMYPSPTYKIQKIANQFAYGDFSIRILFLPVAHTDLNPVEVIWGHVKSSVAAKDLHFKLTAFEEETKVQIDNMTTEKFTKLVAYAMKEEQKYKKLCLTGRESLK